MVAGLLFGRLPFSLDALSLSVYVRLVISPQMDPIKYLGVLEVDSPLWKNTICILKNVLLNIFIERHTVVHFKQIYIVFTFIKGIKFYNLQILQ